MSVSDGSPMKHVEVSDGSPIRHVGLRWVSDTNNIFVNSRISGSSHSGSLNIKLFVKLPRLAFSFPQQKIYVAKINNKIFLFFVELLDSQISSEAETDNVRNLFLIIINSLYY